VEAHEPAASAYALLNSRPMGLYSASQIVQDAQRDRIRVQPVDVRYSDWHCRWESDGRCCHAENDVVRCLHFWIGKCFDTKIFLSWQVSNFVVRLPGGRPPCESDSQPAMTIEVSGSKSWSEAVISRA